MAIKIENSSPNILLLDSILAYEVMHKYLFVFFEYVWNNLHSDVFKKWLTLQNVCCLK